MSIVPFRLNEFRAKLQIVTSARTPSLVRKAAQKYGYASSTHYLQHIILERVAADLGLDNLDELKAELPPNRRESLERMNEARRERAVASGT